MSRFNRLFCGEAAVAADELRDKEATNDELRIALINALERIDNLEKKLAERGS